MCTTSPIALLWLLLAPLACASIVLRTPDDMMLQIDPWGRDSLRVRYGPTIRDDLPGALTTAPSSRSRHVITNENLRSVSNGNIQANLDSNGLITVVRLSDNQTILNETARAFNVVNASSSIYSLSVSYQSDQTERIYALGEHKIGKLDNKGQFYDFHNCLIYSDSFGSEICIPWLLSSKGYGYLWNLPSFGNLTLGETATTWVSVATYQMDFFITTSTPASSNPTADILSNYADATGHAPVIPYYATGFWQCKNRYRNQTELLDVVNGYVSRQLPISIIVVDYFHWDALGDWAFDATCWPDPKGMADYLEEIGVKMVVSVWPLVDSNSNNFGAMNASGYLVQCPAVQNKCHAGNDYLYDPTIPAARDYVWAQVKKGYYDNNIKAYWLDADEPEQFNPVPAFYYSLGTDDMIGMMYPYFHQQTFYNGMKENNETEIITLSRSAWAGTQKWAAAVWSGDIPSTFESLNQQVRIGLNMGLSGIVWWTTDIGGYSGGNITDPVWRELIVRWFQWGAFCPLFRLHGSRIPNDPNAPCGFSGGSNEIWNFGDTAYDAISTVMLIREQLRPYIYEQLQIASLNGTPIMRPLWFDFPQDPNCATIDDQFMFGPDFMVAPVLEYQATNRTVYFPANATWVHWFTKDIYQGGSSVAAFSAPLQTFPLFVRVVE